MMPISWTFWLCSRGGNVAAAVFDDHFHHERHVVGERGQDVVLVEHFDRFVGFDVGRR